MDQAIIPCCCTSFTSRTWQPHGGKKGGPLPHIIFLLIAHFLLPSSAHIPNIPLEEKQAVTPAWLLTNFPLQCHRWFPPSLHSASPLPFIFSQYRPAVWLCPPAGLNLSPKNQWCALKLILEDRRSQTNSHQSPLAHFFFQTHTHYFSHLTQPLLYSALYSCHTFFFPDWINIAHLSCSSIPLASFVSCLDSNFVWRLKKEKMKTGISIQ